MEKQIEVFEKLITSNIKKYADRRSYSYKKVKGYKYPLVLLSAISTIVLGLQFSNGDE